MGDLPLCLIVTSAATVPGTNRSGIDAMGDFALVFSAVRLCVDEVLFAVYELCCRRVYFVDSEFIDMLPSDEELEGYYWCKIQRSVLKTTWPTGSGPSWGSADR